MTPVRVAPTLAIVCMALLYPRCLLVSGHDEFLRKQSILYGISTLAKEESSLCSSQLRTLADGTELRHVWTMKMLDASGQPDSGFIWGKNLWLGSKTQCLEAMNPEPLEVNHKKIPQLSTPEDLPPYPVSFMVLYVNHNSTLQWHTRMPLENILQIGLCVPSSCTSDEIADLAESYFRKELFNFQNYYKVNMKLLDIKTDRENYNWMLSASFGLFVAIGVMTMLLAIIGTIKDTPSDQKADKGNSHVFHISDRTTKNGEFENAITLPQLEETSSKESSLTKICKCFSLKRNFKSIMSFGKSDSTSCLHGLRFWGMIWIVMLHSIYFQADFLDNLPQTFRMSESFVFQTLSNSTYSVDTFLFISGFVLSYLFFKHQRSSSSKTFNCWQKSLQYVVLVIRRFLRITPPYLVTLLLAQVLYQYLQTTTVMLDSERNSETCGNYWWRNLLYINNLFPRSEMCLSWSWYLSLDMQFFVVATLLLTISSFSFYLASGLVISILLTCTAANTLISYSIKYVPTLDDQFEHLDTMYDLPWNRIGPYLVGIITGYLLIRLDGQLKLSKKWIGFFWILFPLINLYITFGIYGRKLSVAYSAVYMGLSRTLWGMGLAWLTIACCTGNAGIINRILSYKAWVPLSRLTYCCYLLHPLITNTMFLSSETSWHGSAVVFILAFFGTFCMSFLAALAFSMLFEAPYLKMIKLAESRQKTSKDQNNSKSEATTVE